MLTRVWLKLEYRIDVCRVTRGAHIEHLLLSKKSVFLWLWTIIIINVCNHGEHYKTPCILVALRYKPEARGFSCRRDQYMFSLTSFFRLQHDPGVDSASKRYDYQGHILVRSSGQYVRLTSLPPSYADCPEIGSLKTPGTLTTCPGLYRDTFTFTFTFYTLTFDPVPDVQRHNK
jgi:hypothetical protein